MLGKTSSKIQNPCDILVPLNCFFDDVFYGSQKGSQIIVIYHELKCRSGISQKYIFSLHCLQNGSPTTRKEINHLNSSEIEFSKSKYQSKQNKEIQKIMKFSTTAKRWKENPHINKIENLKCQFRL